MHLGGEDGGVAALVGVARLVRERLPAAGRRADLGRVQLQLARRLGEHARRLDHVGRGVGGHRGQPQAGGSRRHGGRADRLREHAVLDRLLAHAHGLALVAEHERHDGHVILGDGEALGSQRAAQGASVGVQSLHAMGALL